MDVTTLMMGSTLNPPAMPATLGVVASNGALSVQVTGSSGKSQLFAALLGTSMQELSPATMQQSGDTGDFVAAEIMAMMELLPENADSGLVSETPAPAAVMTPKVQTLSVDDLLQGVKNRLKDSAGAEKEPLKTGKSTELIDLLVGEIHSMLDQNGQYTQKAAGQQQGSVKTETTGGDLLKKVEGMSDETAPNNEANENTSAGLMTLMAALLPEPTLKTQDKKMVNVDTESSADLDFTGADLLQQNAAQENQSGKVVTPESIRTEQSDRLNSGNLTGKSEFGIINAQVAVPDGAKTPVVTEVETHQKTGKIQNVVLKSHPNAFQLPVAEELHSGESREKEVDVEIIVKDEEVPQELLQASEVKPETVALNRPEQQKPGPVIALSSEEKPLQVAGERAVAEEPAVPLSRQQIADQVREKLVEHRITQDNGQVTIRLNPAELGELKISVRMEDQRLRVEIVAENRTVKDALMENIGSLKEALARQNMEMKQFDVSTGSRQFFNQGFREGRQQEQPHITTRQTGWLTGRSAETPAGPVSWQPRDNALLDMMM